MVSRSIASVLLLSMTALTAVSAATPLWAAPGMSVADAAQRVASEQVSVDAEIGLLQTHLEVLEVGAAASQVEADGVRGEADAYLESPEAQRLKSNVEGYDASCTNRVLIGGQRYTCGAASVKLGKLAARYNQAVAEFRERLDEQSRGARRIRSEIALTRNRIQNLQAYAAWLGSARETIAKACGGLATGDASPEEIERRCGHVRFDSLRVDLPPCEAERCPAWAQPWSLRPRGARRRLRFVSAGAP